MIGELELLRLIDLIYQGALDGQTWPFVVQSVAELLGGRSAGLGIQDRRARALRAAVFFEVGPAYQRTYSALITRSDMAGWWRWVEDNAAAKAFTDGAEYRDSRIGSTKLYAEWLQPQQMDHGLIAPLLDATSFAGGLFITRPAKAGPFEDDQVVTLAALQPHLLRAVQVRLRLQAVETANRQALESLDRVEQGVLLVDAQGALLHANRAAALVLGGGKGLMTGRGVLACDHADDTSRLRRLIGEASTGQGDGVGGMLAVRRASGRRPLSVLVAPLRGQHPVLLQPHATAILFVSDPEQVKPATDAQLSALYGLTGAEARIARSLLDADRLADIAEKLGITLSTVRTHLQRAFEKTGTRRQSELVRLVLAHRLPADSTAAPTADRALA